MIIHPSFEFIEERCKRKGIHYTSTNEIVNKVELTPTMKIKRRLVMGNFEEQIENCYWRKYKEEANASSLYFY